MTSKIGVKKIQYPNGTDIITLDSSGSLAIGNSATVGGTLGVTGTQTNNGNFVVSKAIPNVDIKDTGTAQASMDFLSNSDTVRATIGMERSAGGGLFVGSSAYSAVFGTASSGNTEFATNNNIRMTIDADGNVGIGNSNPSSFGATTDNLVIGTTSGENGMTIASGTGNGGRIQFADNTTSPFRGAFEYDHSSDKMIIYTSGNNRMSINAGGRIQTFNCTNSHGSLNLVGEGGLGYRAASFQHTTNGAEVGYIATSSTNTVFNTASDYRLKENVSYDFDATSRLKQLKPCRFNFIIDADKTVDGFLAHEVSSIVPEAISGEKDAMTEEVLYVDGDKIPDGKKVGDVKEASKINVQGIDHSKLVPLLVKTIQELEARIATLESK